MLKINVPVNLPENFKELVAKEFLNTFKDELIENISNKIIESNQIQQLYTVKEVSRLLGISEKAVCRHIDNGLLKASKPGKSFIIKQNDINEYLNINVK